MFNIKKTFGLMYQNHMYVVQVPIREDRGDLFQLPMKAAQMAEIVVDLSDHKILKCRYEDELKWDSLVPGILIMFASVRTITLDELRLTKQEFINDPWW